MIGQLVRNWKWVGVRGALGILFGTLTLIYPAATLVAFVAMFGAYAIVDGLLLFMSAIANRRTRKRWRLLLTGGLLGIATGVLTFAWPAITALALLAIIEAWAILMGVIEITSAIRLRRDITGEWAMVLSGLLAIALGVMLAINPGVGALAVVVWIGAYAVVSGALLVALAFRLRHWGRAHGLLAAA